MTVVRSPVVRARLRAGAALLMAAVGAVVAVVAPQMVTDAAPVAATWWVVLGILGGVVALLAVVAGNLVTPRHTGGVRTLARAGVLIGCVVVAGYVLGLALLADAAVRDEAMTFAPVTLPYAAVAVLLGVITVRLDDGR
ncbi:MAG: hypothetical protein M3237_00490 [Actinomycetota bacterium]|nr:hypothetical protein [Actinomycetota bacterium]